MVFDYLEGVMKDIRFDGVFNFEITNIGFVSVVRDENYTFEFKEGKNQFSLIYVERGSLKYFLGNKKITLNRSDLFFVPKNTPYKTKYLKNNTTIKIILFDTVGNTLPFSSNKPFVENSSEFQQIFSSLTISKSNNTLYLMSKLYEIFYLFQDKKPSMPKKYQKIILAVNEIEYNYQEDNKVLYYADKCNMSESNFRKLFKEYTGKTPIEYRNFIRLSVFQKLMESGEFTVSEAAYLVGFNNMSFFYDVYNRYKT